MFTDLNLRLRIFLFFCLLATGGLALAAAALFLGFSRAEDAVFATPFLVAFVVFGFLNTGLVLGVWLLFDEHVAKPINKLSSELRLKAHSDVETNVSPETARYLGDLAPAAEALSQTASVSVLDTAEKVTRETERLKVETERLTELLTEAPVATIVLNRAKEIVLYDAQAAGVLSQIAPPRLKAPLADYFATEKTSAAIEQLSGTTKDVTISLPDSKGESSFSVKLKALGSDGYILFIDVDMDRVRSIAPRPLVFDFDLMNAAETNEINNALLSDLCFVPFDTETTGLSIEKDDIIQLGALRVLNGRIIEGEVFNSFVDPGRPIPPASTKIHRITDEDVAGAPDIAKVGRNFHDFARDSVLVAHNAPFDIGLLRRLQSRMEVEWNHPVLDTVLLSAVVFGTNEKHSLDVLCERLSITIPDKMRHTAFGDAKATADVLIKLLPLLSGKGISTFGQLIAETKRHGRLLNDLNS